MLSNITSLTGNGLKDWLIQRVTAVYFALYSFWALSLFFRYRQAEYADWQQLLHCPLVKIASILAVLAFSLHAWVGLWTVSTDYLKCTRLRLSLQLLLALLLLAQFFWALMLIWSV